MRHETRPRPSRRVQGSQLASADQTHVVLRWAGFMKGNHAMRVSTFVLAGALAFGGVSVQAAGETVQSMLAAQIRLQGFVCEKPLGATPDAERSKPDHTVWVLKCSNANYRVSRAPDMAAKVQPLQ